MKKVFLLSFLALMLFSVTSIAQSAVGTWKTIDDETGEEKSYVEIVEKDGKYYGTVSKILREEHVNDVCSQCNDYRKDKPILGMEILSDMSLDGDTYSGGEIVDPENGKTYRAKMWRDGDNLMVRGYVAFLYRTQTWLPVK